MDKVLDNSFANSVLKNHYTLTVSVVFLVLIIFIIVFYDLIYAKSGESHFDKIGKASMFGLLAGVGMVYLYDYKNENPAPVSGYDDLAIPN